MLKGLQTSGRFSLELSKDTTSVICTHCGKQLSSVCGFISRDGEAYCTYFALLHTGHDEIVVLLTISIGKWWDENALNERHWTVLRVWPSETQFNMRIEEPEQSRHANWKPLGVGLSRNEVQASPLLKDFLEVADYIVAKDPTVNSYLNGEKLNTAR